MFWKLEPGTEIRPQASLPNPADGLDVSETFSAFLDAARWGAVAAADPTAFQSPFRAGIEIKDPSVVMHIGPSTTGQPLEIGVLHDSDETVVIHAMVARRSLFE